VKGETKSRKQKAYLNGYSHCFYPLFFCIFNGFRELAPIPSAIGDYQFQGHFVLFYKLISS